MSLQKELQRRSYRNSGRRKRQTSRSREKANTFSLLVFLYFGTTGDNKNESPDGEQVDDEAVEDANDENDDVVQVPCGACLMIEKLEGLSSNSEEEIEETTALMADNENKIAEEHNEEEKENEDGDEENNEESKDKPEIEEVNEEKKEESGLEEVKEEIVVKEVKAEEKQKKEVKARRVNKKRK